MVFAGWLPRPELSVSTIGGEVEPGIPPWDGVASKLSTHPHPGPGGLIEWLLQLLSYKSSMTPPE